jgi:hypothetical protein
MIGMVFEGASPDPHPSLHVMSVPAEFAVSGRSLAKRGPVFFTQPSAHNAISRLSARRLDRV